MGTNRYYCPIFQRCGPLSDGDGGMAKAADIKVDAAAAGFTPLKLIQLYSPAEWEDFVGEWAGGFDPPYFSVHRLGGAGDKGRDVVGYLADPQASPEWDSYQCKHYDHPLMPSDVYTELGKLCVYTHRGDYSVPRRYRFVAPQGIGTKLHDLLRKPDVLRAELCRNWMTHCHTKISDAEEFPLGPDLKRYVESFDFGLVFFLEPRVLLEQHRRTEHWSRRFPAERIVRPAAQDPPTAVQQHELPYVSCLLDAYKERLRRDALRVVDLAASPALDEHFRASRGCFFAAEALNRFSRDHLEAGTFDDMKQDIYDGVKDVTLAEHKDGFACVLEATKTALLLALPDSTLKPHIRPGDRKGICHHLANDGRVKWVKS